VRKRFALAVLAALAARPAAADQAPASDTEPSPASPHNCITYYPEAAVKAGAEGVATVAFTIAADGSVKDARIDKSSGNADLDAASLACTSQWRYTPARHGGVAVDAPWKANVQWKMHGGTDYRMMAHCARFHALTAQMLSGISGVTALTYRVMPNGTLGDIAVAQSSGDKSLDDAALSCLHDMHYNTENLDIAAEGIPGHALMDWRSEYLRGVPLTPPYPPDLTPPVPLAGKPCDKMTAATRGAIHDGETVVEFTIATDGSVRDVELTHASGNSALDDATKDCVAADRFMPANDKGVPYAVKWWVKVEWHAGRGPDVIEKL
jgi:TonB family protein